MERRIKLLADVRKNPDKVIEQMLQLEQANAAQEAVIAEQRQKIQEQQREIEEQQQAIQELKRQLFGPRSEKLSPEQEQQLAEVVIDLHEQDQRPPADSVEIVDAQTTPGNGCRSPRRRHRMPAQLEVLSQVLEPEACPHCGALGERIGEEVSEELDLIPARLVLRRTIRVKRVCRCGCGGIAIAPLPAKLLPGSKLGVGLGVFILLSKYDDHLALYTLERIFSERHQVVIPRQQMVQWIEVMAGLLRPLVQLMWERMKRGGYLQIDETPVKVLDPEVEGKAATGYLWFFAVPGGDVFLEYADGRAHTIPLKLLEGFSGSFQSDAFEGYETLLRKRPDLKRLGCAAHARRKFYTAALEKDAQAIWFISRFRELYKIEDAVQGLLPEQRQKERELKAPALWEEMLVKARELAPQVLPQSSLGKALRYFLNEYNELKIYLERPEYKIDNNLVENAIRPSCVGKKRWLFIGHPEAGWRSAVIYSLIQSCRRRGINPQDYLTDILTRLPSLKTTGLEQLLPENWNADRAADSS